MPIEPLYIMFDRNLYRISNTDTNPDSTTYSGTAQLSTVGVSSDSGGSGSINPEDIVSGALSGNIEVRGGYLQSGNFVSGSAGWKIDSDGNIYANSGTFRGDITGATGTFSGTVNVGSLNIPDSTTANSFHVDASGNTWWGANVATGYAGANAYVLATGVAVLKSVSVGGTSIQYTMRDTGIGTFGDGSDGSLTTSGDVTLTADKYYTDLTIATGNTFNPAGYRVFCTGTMTLQGTGKIARNGVAGTTGSNGSGAGGGSGGAGGTALADGYLKGSLAGTTGGSGGSGFSFPTGGANGGTTTGTATTNSIGLASSAGGSGGSGGSSSNGSGGSSTGSAATASNVKLIANWHLSTLLDIGSTGSTIKFDNSAAAAGGAGGGGGGGDSGGGSGQLGGGGGGGGGAGSGGGIIAIYARNIVIGASASITATGGNGANGGNGAAGVSSGDHIRYASGGGAGGGGAGGNGGQIILVYNTLTNSGSITASAGTAGTAGGVGAAGTNPAGSAGNTGNSGNAGTAGTIRQFQVSL